MTAEKYNQMASYIRSHTYGVKTVYLLSGGIVWTTILCYLGALSYAFFMRDYTLLYHSILVPGVAFVIVSAFRHFYNAKRPYEEMDIDPIIKKEKAGKSFPSRHVFSIFMVGMTFLQIHIVPALIFFVMGVVLAVLRVIGGVHYTRDVVAGAAIGILSGILGYFVVF